MNTLTPTITPNSLELKQRLAEAFKDAERKAVMAVSRGNVCLLRGNYVTEADFKARKQHAVQVLKNMY